MKYNYGILPDSIWVRDYSFICKKHGVKYDDFKAELLRLKAHPADFDVVMERVITQLHVAQEETKFGLSAEKIHPFFQQITQMNLNNISINGIMAMASFTEDQSQIEAEFDQVAKAFQEIKSQYYSNNPHFCELSIGMSSDYNIAIEKGSTLIRVGSAVFA